MAINANQIAVFKACKSSDPWLATKIDTITIYNIFSYVNPKALPYLPEVCNGVVFIDRNYDLIYKVYRLISII